MSDLVSGLNDEQREAVITTEGPVLVLAGAGSGKTRVLTHRIAYILEQNLASLNQILAVTFTNKAAAEMKERIGLLLENSAKRVPNISWAGTFHSICLRILKTEGDRIGLSSSFTIYDSNDSLDVVKESMNRLFIDKKEINPYAVKSHISSAKNELITSQAYKSLADGFFQEKVAAVYPIYQEILRENQALDFDDLIMYTTQLFKNHPAVLEKYKKTFKYIHVDEYQDTNHAQYVLIKQLSTKNICVVGDDDQSIYGFRGANIQNILNFEKDFANAKIIKLERNYRSTQQILDASHAIVNKNENRRDKKLWTDKIEGNSIKIHTALDETDESNWVAETCMHLIQDSTEPKDIAVLYRTNAQSRNIEESFIRYELPYKIVGGIRFYDRKEIKDILAYLRIISNPEDALSFSRIVNTPRRGIGKKGESGLFETAKSLNLSPVQFLVNETESIKNPKIKAFSNILVDFFKTKTECSLTQLIRYVIDRSGYIEFLDDGSNESQGRIENIQELISVAAKYDETEDIDQALQQFLEDVALIEQQVGNDLENSITLMTIHASKGLEFKHVFVIGMEESIFPHSRSYSDHKELEEERRLAYVAVTRAKEFLYMTHATSRMFYGKIQANPISRFLEDIPNKLTKKSSSGGNEVSDDIFDHYFEEEPAVQLNAKVGDKVKHEMFGKGKIIDLDESVVTVDFGPGVGEKDLAIEYARLVKI